MEKRLYIQMHGAMMCVQLRATTAAAKRERSWLSSSIASPTDIATLHPRTRSRCSGEFGEFGRGSSNCTYEYEQSWRGQEGLTTGASLNLVSTLLLNPTRTAESAKKCAAIIHQPRTTVQGQRLLQKAMIKDQGVIIEVVVVTSRQSNGPFSSTNRWIPTPKMQIILHSVIGRRYPSRRPFETRDRLLRQPSFELLHGNRPLFSHLAHCPRNFETAFLIAAAWWSEGSTFRADQTASGLAAVPGPNQGNCQKRSNTCKDRKRHANRLADSARRKGSSPQSLGVCNIQYSANSGRWSLGMARENQRPDRGSAASFELG